MLIEQRESAPLAKPSAPEAWELFAALIGVLGDLGQREAVEVLYRVEAAVFDASGSAPGQKRTNAEALSDMATIASSLPDRRGRRPTPENVACEALVRYVTSSRRDGKSDATLSYAVAIMWLQACGTPKPQWQSRIAAALAKDLADPDPERFVRAVHRALGLPGTGNLGNAASKAKSRAHAVKRRTRAS